MFTTLKKAFLKATETPKTPCVLAGEKILEILKSPKPHLHVKELESAYNNFRAFGNFIPKEEMFSIVSKNNLENAYGIIKFYSTAYAANTVAVKNIELKGLFLKSA